MSRLMFIWTFDFIFRFSLITSFGVKLNDDFHECYICGIDVMLNGTIVIADYNNRKIKLFDGDSMDHLSSVRMRGQPSDMVVSASIDNEAIVSLWHENQIAFLELKDVYQPYTKEILQLEYPVIAAIEYGDKIIAISHDIPSVKLIDRTGRLFWSTSLAQSPRTSTLPGQIISYTERGQTVCVISDERLGTLTKLDVKSGNILKTYKCFRDVPAGMCADGKGTIYVCYDGSFDLTALSTDFARESVLLSQKDGVKVNPSIVRYNSINGALLIGYDGSSNSRNYINCFKCG